MNLSSEIEKLRALHEQGALSDREFARAKAALLDDSSGHSRPARRRGELDNDETLNTILKWSAIIYVALSVVGALVGAWIFFNFFMPLFNGAD